MKTALVHAAAVGSGGFLGALARYGLNALVQRRAPLVAFPFGTLAVNLIGCFVIGLIAGLAESRQLFGPELRAFAIVGVLGGFTTFSTFGYEAFAMIRNDDYSRAVVYLGAHIVVGLALVWLGYAILAPRVP